MKNLLNLIKAYQLKILHMNFLKLITQMKKCPFGLRQSMLEIQSIM